MIVVGGVPSCRKLPWRVTSSAVCAEVSQFSSIRSFSSVSAPVGAGIRGQFLVEKINRACKQDVKSLPSVSHQLLKAMPAMDIETVVFSLNRLSHSGCFRDKQFWKLAAVELSPRIKDLNNQLLGLTANSFAKASTMTPDLLKAISSRVMSEMPDMDVKNLALFVHAAKRMGSKEINPISMHLGSRVAEMSEHEASQYFSSLTHSTEMDAERLRKELAVLRFMPTVTVAQLVQAYARVSAKDECVLNRLKHSIVAQLKEFPPQSLSMVANAYAKLGLLDREFLSAIAAVATSSIKHAIGLDVSTASGIPSHSRKPTRKCNETPDHVSVTQLMNAHSKMRLFNEEFFKSAVDWMTPSRVATFSPQSIANALHAFAKFPVLYSQRAARMELRATFAVFVPEILKRLQDFSVQNLVNAVHSFSALSTREPTEIFDGIIAELLQRQSNWNKQDVANLATTLARIEWWNPLAFRALAKRVNELSAESFKTDELATTLNSFAHYVAAQRAATTTQNSLTDGGSSAVVLKAFEASQAHLSNLPAFARGSTVETALLLNAYAKVQFHEGPVIECAILDLENRAFDEQLPARLVSPVLSALARIQRYPPSTLEVRITEVSTSGNGGLLKKSTDTAGLVAILSSLGRLDVRPGRGRGLDKVSGLLLLRLASELESSPRGWNIRTLPTALHAIAVLGNSCVCGCAQCPVCCRAWRTSVSTLLGMVSQKVNLLSSETSHRQVWLAISMIFNFKCKFSIDMSRDFLHLLRALVDLTRWYRPPKLSLGEDPTTHSTRVDDVGVASVVRSIATPAANVELSAQVCGIFSISVLFSSRC